MKQKYWCGLLCILFCIMTLIGCGSTSVEQKAPLREMIYVGQIPISEYQLCYRGAGSHAAAERLADYIDEICGVKLSVASRGSNTGRDIVVSVDKDFEKVSDTVICDGTITLTGKNADALQKEVDVFANTYLGMIYAGTPVAHIGENTPDTISIPEQLLSVEEEWIPNREAIVTLWNVNWSRGAYLDSDVSVKNNILYFTDDQLYEYVKMLKFCGFTGVQVTDMCSAWAGLGGYQPVHEKIRKLANAAHSLDMQFTLWVWGAEFSDCGYVDRTVYYGADGKNACEDQEAIETFEKYYDIYAELADCCDRVIGHYYDPSNLYNEQDIGYFAKMLREKFRAVNPDIEFGLSCWVDVYDKDKFIEILGNDVMLLEGGHHDDPQGYYHFHTKTLIYNCKLGTWAWNTCEMEIDQLAQMNVNANIIKSVYQTAREYDEIAKSTYWSEMDSYHLLNVFSLYCAGHLLQNPDLSTDMLLQEVSLNTVGPEYAEVFAELLGIIETARSGDSWDTYFWNKDTYIVKSDAYPAEEILECLNRDLPVLKEMIDKELSVNTMPLPVSLTDLLRLMEPHLQQIKEYAQFRIGLSALREEYAKGMSEEALQNAVNKLSIPVKNYNTVIGAWGQIEARAQHELLDAFCKEVGIDTPVDPVFNEERKNRIYAQLVALQRACDTPYRLYEPYYQFGLAYGTADTNAIVEELVTQGLFVRESDGAVTLKNWENYRYHFD